MPRAVLYFLLTTFAVLTFINCTKTDADRNDQKTEAPATKMGQDIKDTAKDYDMMGAMKECNETFIVEMSYLDALNNSGSFPDETDKTPKCYLRCVLQNLKIASADGVIDPVRTALIFAGERNGTPMDGIEEIATQCVALTKDMTCKCEMAYSFLKCLFTMEIERYEKKS